RCSPMHARAGTAATRWLVCCGNRYSVALPDTRMSMTPSACATIRLCAGLSAAKRRRAARLRRVRWAASRRNGSRRPRTSLLLPTCLASFLSFEIFLQAVHVIDSCTDLGEGGYIACDRPHPPGQEVSGILT